MGSWLPLQLCDALTAGLGRAGSQIHHLPRVVAVFGEAGWKCVPFPNNSVKKKKRKENKCFQIVLPFKILSENKRTEKKEEGNNRGK